MPLTLGELAQQTGTQLHGDAQCLISSVASLENAGPGAISFLVSARYRRYLAATGASAVILAREFLAECPVSALVSENPHVTYARVAGLLYPPPPARRGIHPSASVSAASSIDPDVWVGAHCVVEEGVVLAAGVQVGPGCIIEAHSSIGECSRLVAHVTVCHGSRIGRNVLLHPGVVIGADGFGLAKQGEVWIKVPQVGAVSIGDDVEIGANTTVDRGAVHDTVIEHGVKLDNQIQVGHNVRIGACTAIAGCVGIAGSTHIGRNCTIGGGTGIGGHLEIADDVHVTGMSMVTKSITQPGLYSSGMPLQTNMLWRRNIARLRQLEELAQRVKALERVAAAPTSGEGKE